MPDQATPTAGRRRGGAGGAAARLMEKIVPGASAMKAKTSKKDQYLLKRRDAPEPAQRPPLPDAPPPAPAPALEDGPPGFPGSGDPPTPPLPGSSVADEEEFMLQRRAPPVELPPAAQATEAAVTATAVAANDAAPKKAAKAKKPRKREREESADASAAAATAADGEPKKKKKKKKKISNLDAAGGSGKLAAFPDPNALDLTQVISDVRNLPLAPFHGADRRISDAARSFVLAFRSKYYKKSYENDPPEEARKSLDKPNAAAADGQPLKKKKAVAARPGVGNDPTKAGVKRAPSDRQEELAVKKKAKLEKIKILSSEKKAVALEQKDSAVASSGAPAAQQARPKEKGDMAAARKKEPAAAPRMKTPSKTSLCIKFPMKSTLPSIASLKARFARFGPLDVDDIRVFWKSNTCRVVYKFRSDAEAALRYARANAMFGQVDAYYYIKDDPPAAAAAAAAPEAPPQAQAQEQRSELRLMETAPFRPGSSGNGAPLAMSRAAPARPAVGQQPKSILKKSTDDGASGAAREVPRVKFMLDGGDSKLEPPALPAFGGAGAGAAAAAMQGAKSVGFGSPQPMQPPSRALAPPMRPAQQPLQLPRAAVTQQLPPPPPLMQPYQPRGSDYPPHRTEGPLAFSSQPSQPLHYPGAGPSALPGPPPPYLARSTSFPGQQQQQQAYPPRAGDKPAVIAGQAQQQVAGEEVPAWKTSKEAFEAEAWRLMTGIAKMVEPLTGKDGYFPYHLFSGRSG